MSLKKNAAKGSLWTSITQIGISICDFFVFAYLARVLTLEEFGLAGFCYLFIEFANIFVVAGVNQNLVQRKEWEDIYASSTLIFVLAMALGVICILALVGVPIAYFLHSESAAWILASLLPIILFTSGQVVASGKLLREFRIKSLGFSRLLSTLLAAAVSLTLANLGFGIWSLIIGKLTQSVSLCIFLNYQTKIRFKLSLTKSHNRELIQFCFPLLGMSVMSFFHNKANVMFTGLVLGPASFALLSASKKGETMLNQITMSSINSMVVPSFARVADRDELGNIYIRMVALTALLVFPVFMGLAAIAEPFVLILFGEKFLESANYITISAIGIFPSVIAWFLPSLLVACAETRAAFKLSSLNILSSVFVAGVTIWFGIDVMLWSVVLSGFLLLPVRLSIVNQYVVINFADLVRKLLPTMVSSLSMFAVVRWASGLLSNYYIEGFLHLVLLVFVGGLVYVTVLLTLFTKQTFSQIKELTNML